MLWTRLGLSSTLQGIAAVEVHDKLTRSNMFKLDETGESRHGGRIGGLEGWGMETEGQKLCKII